MSWNPKVSGAEAVTYYDSDTNRKIVYTDPKLGNMSNDEKIGYVKTIWTDLTSELSHANPLGPKS